MDHVFEVLWLKFRNLKAKRVLYHPASVTFYQSKERAMCVCLHEYMESLSVESPV
jgi:hypothetical protein